MRAERADPSDGELGGRDSFLVSNGFQGIYDGKVVLEVLIRVLLENKVE